MLRVLIGASVTQTYVTGKIANYLSEKMNAIVTVGKVDIKLISSLALEDVLVLDHKNDTLIYVNELEVDIRSYSFEEHGTALNFGDLYLKNTVFNLVEYKGESINNLMQVIHYFASSDTTSSPSTDLKISSTNVKIENLDFTYDNQNDEAIPFGIDWSHIAVTGMKLDLDNFELHNDTINGLFKHFSLKEQSGFELNNFLGQATFSDTKTEVEGLVIQTPQTDLDMDLIFRYDSVADYSEFIERVLMKGKMRESKVSFEDIAIFAPILEGLEEVVEVSGRVRGYVNNFTAKSLDIKLADHTVIQGRLDINGLPEIDETFIQLDLTELNTNASDLRQVPIPPFHKKTTLKVPELIDKMGTIHFDGNFTGFINDFVAYGNFDSDIGKLKTDLQLANDKATDDIHYEGKLNSRSFDLGKLFGLSSDILGKLNMSARVNGTGVDENLSAKLIGKIQSIEINQYSYNDIELNGTWDKSKFLGDFHIKDDNIKLDFDGELDFRKDLPKFKFEAALADAKINQLNWMKRDSSAVLSSNVLIRSEGNSINNILGRVALDHFEFHEKEKDLVLKKIELLAFSTPDGKVLGFESDHVTSSISGKFDSRKLPGNFEYMLYKILPSFFDSPPAIPDSTQQFDFKLKVKELGDFAKLFIPGVENIDQLDMTASLDARDNFLEIDLLANKLQLESIELIEPHLKAKSISDSVGIAVQLKQLQLSDSLSLDSVEIVASASSDVIYTDIEWDNKKKSNRLRGDLSLEAQILRSGTYKVDVHESELQMIDNKWNVFDSNYILFDGDEITVSNFKLINRNQYLKINGALSRDPEKTMEVELHDFNLSRVNDFMPSSIELSGTIEGKAVVKDVYDNVILNSNFDLDTIRFNNNDLGSGKLFSFWKKGNKRIDFNFNLNHENVDKISLNGGYYPFKSDSNLLFDIAINDFPVNVVEPFVEENIDELRGALNGKIKVTGSTEKPLLNGGFKLKRGNAHVIYLNTEYRINEADFFVYEDLIGCDYISVYDQEGNVAKVNVSVFHDNFNDFNYDIWLSADNGLLALNTTSKDNDLFYGTARITPGSTVTIETGRKGNINMEVTAGTGPGTMIYLPLDYAEQADDAKYIFFVDTSDHSSSRIAFKEKINEFEGFSMNFNLEVDENAKIQLIFDKTLGDVIEGTGNGNLKMNINQSGDFELIGDYDITEGSYLFTLESIINKKFKVDKGSSIKWEGDPLEGESSINAYYSLKTNLLDLGLSFTADSNELRKRIPVDLLLTMKGNYMKPDIEFDFRLPDNYSDYQNYLSGMSDNDKSVQAISLLLLNKFMPVNSTDVSSGNALGKSGSELLSRQLSNWLSQISDEFDLDFNYQPGDNISSEQVELALSTQLWNDKFTFETNIGYQGDNPNANQGNNSQIVGDFKLEYKISDDGKVRGSAFHRSNNDNTIESSQFPYTQGVGILYQEDFETITHFMCRVKKRFISKEKKAEMDCDEMERKRILKKREKQNKKLDLMFGTTPEDSTLIP